MPDASAPTPTPARHLPDGLLRMTLDLDAATCGTAGPDGPRLTLRQLEALLDTALRTLAQRVAAGQQVEIPHLGTLEIAPSRHRTSRTLVYRASPDLMEAIR